MTAAFSSQPFNPHTKPLVTSSALTRLTLLLVLFAGLGWQAIAHAQTYCVVDKLAKFTWQKPLTDQLIHLTSDHATASHNLITMTGNIQARYQDNYFTASKLMLDKNKDTLTLNKDIIYGQPQFALRAQSGKYVTENKTGVFKDIEYFLAQNGAVGSAEQISFDRIAKVENLLNATYTTCPRDNPTWQIGAAEMTLNHETGIGTAKKPAFYLGKTKILTFPYISFALDDRRKTGFLYPRFSLTQQRGLQTDIPYYFNIAPNIDNTLTTRLMSKRGVMFDNEFRYLFDGMKGSIETGSLPYDKQTGQSDVRWRFALKNEFRPRDDLSISLLYQRVSDGTYFTELEDTLDLVNDSFLESHLRIHYHPFDNLHASAEWEQYQLTNPRLQEKDKPYERRPRLKLDGDWSLGAGLSFTHSHEYTDFYKPQALTGQRFHQALTLAYQYDTPSFFFRPAVKHQYTHYKLSDGKANTYQKNTLNRSVPTFSADAGFRFEREFTWRNQDIVQTLEPRIFYLRTPYRQQSDLPNFDTERLDSSYDFLFLDDRFNGNDRVGDANQLTTAISSRFLDKNTGEELGKVAIGQIQFFDDRRVSLGDNQRDLTPRSELIVESSAKVSDQWRTRGLWHGSQKGTERRIFGAQYQQSNDKLVNLYYLFDKKYYEQADVSGVWRLSDHWRTFWRYNHSIRQDKTIDALFGFEYGECCSAVRFSLRQHRPQSLSDELRTAFYLEFSFNGLGDIGLQTSSQLHEIIPGYQKPKYGHQNEK